MIYITDYDTAFNALQDSISDVRADMGDEAVDEGYADIVEAVAWNCDDATARELFRAELGYVTQTFARLRGIDATDFLEGV